MICIFSPSNYWCWWWTNRREGSSFPVEKSSFLSRSTPKRNIIKATSLKGIFKEIYNMMKKNMIHSWPSCSISKKRFCLILLRCLISFHCVLRNTSLDSIPINLLLKKLARRSWSRLLPANKQKKLKSKTLNTLLLRFSIPAAGCQSMKCSIFRKQFQ